jgi:hypothetical protein
MRWWLISISIEMRKVLAQREEPTRPSACRAETKEMGEILSKGCK